MNDHRDSRRGEDRAAEADRPRSGDEAVDGDVDRLVRLIGTRALAEVDPAIPAGERFFDWWARELRESSLHDPALAARSAAFESRLRSRVAEREHRVRIIADEPRSRPAPMDGTVAGLLDQAGAARCAPALDLRVAAGVGRDLWDESCTSWIELPDDVRSGQHIALTVAGESMEPLLFDGDTILVRIGSTLERDAVVVARRPDDGYVVKRVAGFGPRVVELASLHPGFPPIRIPRRDDLILGTVLLCWRNER